MATNFGLPFGPTTGPASMVTSVGFFDDFIGSGMSASAEVSVWNDHGTTTSTVTQAHTLDEPNGAVDITSGATTDDDGGLQLNGEPIAFNRGADMAMEVRFKVAAIATNVANVFVGLGITELDVGAGTITAAHVGFAAVPAVISATSADGTTQTSTSTGTSLVADTYIVAKWVYRATAGKIVFYLDGNKVATHDTRASSPANIPDGDQLTISLNAEWRAGTGSTLTVDYVAFSGDRTN